MSAQHTPGPWRVGPVDDTRIVSVKHDEEIAIASGDYDSPEGWPIMEANARLIAAAPDLLDALQKLCATLNDNGYATDHAAAAIAKATQP